MKKLAGLLLWVAFSATASQPSVTPQSLQASIDKIGAAETIRGLDEKGINTLSEGILNADTQWIALVPKLAPGLEGGNATTVAEALANALPKNAPAVIDAISAKKNTDFPGRNTVCTMPFSGKDDNWLARYYKQSHAALKKLGTAGKPCNDQLEQAISGLKNTSTQQQHSRLNRQKLTPELILQAIDRDGVDDVISQLSAKQRANIGEAIAQGKREWLLVADSLAESKDAQMHSMLLTALAKALSQNPGDVLTVAKGHVDADLLCGMPFPEASKSELMQYYHATRKALLKIRRRGEACLAVLDQEQSTLVNSPGDR